MGGREQGRPLITLQGGIRDLFDHLPSEVMWNSLRSRPVPKQIRAA